MTEVVLVDIHDREIGSMEKMEAHQKGILHRAFSVFIFNSKGEMLLQKRAKEKYHSGGLWTNACCSHPYPGEEIHAAAKRRLMEEIGIDCHIESAFSFIYKVALDKGMTEHELDHVFIGTTDNLPRINNSEAEDYKYVTINELEVLIKNNPGDFTEWFKIALNQTLDYYNSNNKRIPL